jgi:hypothetical protein
MFEVMKFAMLLSPDDRLEVSRQCWMEIEQLGFDALALPDTPLLMRDPFVSLAALAIDTSHVPLMLAVTNPLTRDPSVMAGTVWRSRISRPAASCSASEAATALPMAQAWGDQGSPASRNTSLPYVARRRDAGDSRLVYPGFLQISRSCRST